MTNKLQKDTNIRKCSVSLDELSIHPGIVSGLQENKTDTSRYVPATIDTKILLQILIDNLIQALKHATSYSIEYI